MKSTYFTQLVKKKIICLLILFSLPTFLLGALGSVTYNHDASVMNQFLVMETGAGALVPPIWYTTFHKAYYATAYPLSKSLSRLALLSNISIEKEHADSIKTAMEREAKVAAVDLGERFAVAGENFIKITTSIELNLGNSLSQAQHKIKRIANFGTGKEFAEWQNQYNLLQNSINCIRSAYLPVSMRQRQYSNLLLKAQKLNKQLSKRLDFLVAYQELLDADKEDEKIQAVDHEVIAARAILRWQKHFRPSN